jgi:FixJ family two-component response regulator
MSQVEKRLFMQGATTLERNPSVLFVDDELPMAMAMQRSLRPYQVDLNVAYHGMQGIVDALANRPDVIITDINMPFASGEELIECLSSNAATAGTPIVVLTGRLDVRLTTWMRRSGVVEVFTKPVAFGILLAALTRYIPLAKRNSFCHAHAGSLG